ncbi:ribonuclease R [Methylopila jiangsuensis]|uniref:Ribonuclease R n=1 Tax=Methylopila jiangsuensis TaxID=586230 RepID=A0A9W6N2Q2_9HYPH|nr:ribonuclease R [Methylopila jiangsuensis]GLK75446.1 ribonuclease R [Methylopila jiangsuensis]
MARRIPSKKAPAPTSRAPLPRGLPTREELVAFIAAQGGKTGKREIARAFHITGPQRIELKLMLADLEADGVVSRRGRTLGRAGHLPSVVLADVTGRDEDGELIARPADWDEDEHGAAPRILVQVSSRGRAPGLAPGVGDRILTRVEPLDEVEPDGPTHQGRVVKILSKPQARILGLFRALPDGSGRLVPVDKKNMGKELAIAADATDGAQDGDLIAADIVKQGRYGLPSARVRERLGSLKSEKAVSLIAIHAHAIPHVFSREALAEAEAARPAAMAGREDWRRLPLVTIDPVDAKDHDDAVHAEPDPDPANAGGHILTVAIADVASYVRPGSALDRTALDRGNSVYFPDRVVPMLPERISNDLCSLREKENRPALAARMWIAKDGRKLRHTFHRVMMKSAAKLSYSQAQASIDGAPDEATGPLLDVVLRPLWAAYASLKTARDARGPLDLDIPERKLVLKPDGALDHVTTPVRLDAHRLIEEFMILANVAAAETLEQKRTPLIYRVHDAPSLEKLEALRELLTTLDIEFPKSGNLRPAQFNRILARVEGQDSAQLVNEVVLRTQAQAEYAAENYGHFGLNLRRYAHFTSPIRRYADLIVHRALVRALELGKDGLPDATTPEQLGEIGARISAAERRAMAAERETVDRLIAHFLADQVGARFTGRIAGVTRSGLFVKLEGTGADGFVPIGSLGSDYFVHDEAARALTGSETGESFRLGDTVEVKLVEAAPVAGALRFEMLSEGRQSRPVGRGKRGLRRAAASRSKTDGKKPKAKATGRTSGAKPTTSGKGRRS